MGKQKGRNTISTAVEDFFLHLCNFDLHKNYHTKTFEDPQIDSATPKTSSVERNFSLASVTKYEI